MRKTKKAPEISVAVMWQDCGDSLRNGEITANDLDAVGRTFLRAAEAVRKRQHGSVECKAMGTSIGVDVTGQFDEEKVCQSSNTLKWPVRDRALARLKVGDAGRQPDSIRNPPLSDLETQ